MIGFNSFLFYYLVSKTFESNSLFSDPKKKKPTQKLLSTIIIFLEWIISHSNYIINNDNFSKSNSSSSFDILQLETRQSLSLKTSLKLLFEKVANSGSLHQLPLDEQFELRGFTPIQKYYEEVTFSHPQSHLFSIFLILFQLV